MTRSSIARLFNHDGNIEKRQVCESFGDDRAEIDACRRLLFLEAQPSNCGQNLVQERLLMREQVRHINDQYDAGQLLRTGTEEGEMMLLQLPVSEAAIRSEFAQCLAGRIEKDVSAAARLIPDLPWWCASGLRSVRVPHVLSVERGHTSHPQRRPHITIHDFRLSGGRPPAHDDRFATFGETELELLESDDRTRDRRRHRPSSTAAAKLPIAVSIAFPWVRKSSSHKSKSISLSVVTVALPASIVLNACWTRTSRHPSLISPIMFRARSDRESWGMLRMRPVQVPTIAARACLLATFRLTSKISSPSLTSSAPASAALDEDRASATTVDSQSRIGLPPDWQAQ